METAYNNNEAKKFYKEVIVCLFVCFPGVTTLVAVFSKPSSRL
jgi:hypothetical protein